MSRWGTFLPDQPPWNNIGGGPPIDYSSHDTRLQERPRALSEHDSWPFCPLTDTAPAASSLAGPPSAPDDGDLEPSPKRCAFGLGDHEDCFVTRVVGVPTHGGHEAGRPDGARNRRFDDAASSRQRRGRPLGSELPETGVFVIGIEASGECGLGDLGLKVSAFCEPDPEMNRFGRLAFPDTVAFDTLEEAMSDVEAMEKLLATTECVILTLPCQNETALKDLNGYDTTSTAHLFTKTQFDFVARFRPLFLLYEMTPPKGGSHTSHQDVISRLHELGYSTDTALVDASTVGDSTSHLRWFAFAALHGPNIKGLLTPSLPC